MLKRKRKTKTELEAEILRLSLRIKHLEQVNAYSRQIVSEYEISVGPLDIMSTIVPTKEECFEVQP